MMGSAASSCLKKQCRPTLRHARHTVHALYIACKGSHVSHTRLHPELHPELHSCMQRVCLLPTCR